MKCPKCKSENVSVQMVTETTLKEKKHGFIWWICVGWYWIPFKWLFLTVPALFIKIFSPKKYKTKVMHKSMCVCQSCGHHWKA